MSVWDNPGEMLSRAQKARSQGDRELAYQMFARASELNPQDAAAWQGRAETASSGDEALISYGYASALDGGNQTLARTLGAAIEQRTTGASKEDAGLLVVLGQELAEVGLTAGARTLFQRASELDDTLADAWVWLAGTTEDSTAQAEYLNKALAVNPRDSRARAGLMAVKPPASLPPVAAVIKPPIAEPALIDSADLNAILAQAMLSDNTAEREELYLRALEIDPDNAQARDGMAMLRVRKLRETVRAAEPIVEPTLPRLTPPKPAPNRLRVILLALIALVVVLALVGMALTLF